MYKLKSSRGGITLPSWDQVSILREPPKSVHTRKKERVDFSDVSYMVRDDSQNRLSENINYIARGVNPHTDVVYTNYSAGGSRTTTMNTPQATNPYKAIRDGAFRPPLYFQEDLQPLSRLQHPNYAVASNPGMSNDFSVPNLVETTDKAPIKNAISVATNTNYIPMNSKASYRIEMPQNVFPSYGIRDDLLKVLANTNVSQNINSGDMVNRDLYKDSGDIKQLLKLGDVHSNFSIYVYNPNTQNYSEIEASIKDKMNIAVQSGLSRPIVVNREDGTPIKIQDYRYKVVNTNAGGQALAIILREDDNIQLDRNIPLYSAGSGYTSYKRDVFSDMNPLTVDKVKPVSNTNINISVGVEDQNRMYDYDVKLRRQANYGSFDNSGTNTTNFIRNNEVSSKRDTKNNKFVTQQYGNRFNQAH